MPAELKGTAKFKVPENAKPGDEIEVNTTFVAEQEDYERSLRARLAQQDRKHQADLAEVDRLHKDEIAKLVPEVKKEEKAPVVDTKTQNEVAELKAKLAKSELDKRVSDAIDAAGLSKIPKVYRESLGLKPDSTDVQIQEALDRLKEDPDLKIILNKTDDKGKDPAPKNERRGGRGSGGSADDAADAKYQALLQKASRNNPKLHAQLQQGNMDAEEQAAILLDWDAKGVLDPKQN